MLTLEPPSRSLWERFHAGDALDPPADRAQARLVEAWQRSRALGVSPEGAAHVAGVDASALAACRERAGLVSAEGVSLLAPIADALASLNCVTILADAEGTILFARGGGEFAERARRTRLVEGAHWSEAARGTNAIGTALALGEPVTVVGSAHYEAQNHGLVCYAAPVRDAYGAICAVVDVTAGVGDASPAAQIAALTTAAALEQVLRARAQATHVGHDKLERDLREGRGARATLLVEAPGIVRAANAAAMAWLGRGALEGRPVEGELGVDWGRVRALALLGSSLVVPSRPGRGARLQRVVAEPLLDAHGELLSVLVHLEPIAELRVTVSRARGTPVQAPVEDPFAALLGDDPALVHARERARRFAASALPLLLVAETGTGKELLARAIHDGSPRAHAPFVAINCGAVPATLLESELFGYAPGAFTGARHGGYVGKLGAAKGGTLLLDEVSEMPDALQAVLLRVLESGTYYRVGDNRLAEADVRIVCATSRDLTALVQAGRFRQDLYFRIKGALLTLPPLRERADRMRLAEALLAVKASEVGVAPPRLAPSARAWIEQQQWPGNVRELKTALHHALVLADGAPVLERAHFPEDEPWSAAPSAPAALEPTATRTAAERSALERALRVSAGNLSLAAKTLGVARSTLYRMMRRHRAG